MTTTYSPSGTDILHRIDLDMVTRRQITEPIHIVQYDDRLPVLEVHLFKEEIPYACPSNSSVILRYEKPDQKIVTNPVLGWNQDRTIIYVQVTIQMTTAYGHANAVLEITSDKKVAASGNFTVIVERNPVQTDAIESTDEFLNLQAHVDEAKQFAAEAKGYRDSAKTYQDNAKTSSDSATMAKDQASTSATQASNSASSAKTYRDEANTANTDAVKQKEEAEKHANISKSYAVGTNNVTRPNDTTDNSKAYAEKAKELTEQAQKLLEQAERLLNTVSEGGIVPMGSILFADLPEVPVVGHMYNIVDSFVTDDRFAEGSDISYPPGTNIYWTGDGNWDVMTGSNVLGVKGSAESDYHQGYVELSPTDFGLENVENTLDSEKNVAYAEEAGTLSTVLPITLGGTGASNNMQALKNLTNSTRLGSKAYLTTNWNNNKENGFYCSTNSANGVPNSQSYSWYGIVITKSENDIEQILFGNYVDNSQHIFLREGSLRASETEFRWDDWQEIQGSGGGSSNPITAGHQLTLVDDMIRLKEYCTLIADWNEADKNGWYMAQNAANAPTSGWIYGYVIAHSNSHFRQIVYHFGSREPDITSNIYSCYERVKTNSTSKWSEWIQAGPVYFNHGTKVFDVSTDSANAGWIKLCSLEITESYRDQPILMDIQQKGIAGTIMLQFLNSSTKDPDVKFLKKTGSLNDIKMVKTSESHWDFYVEVFDHDTVSVTKLDQGNNAKGIKIGWIGELVPAVPTNVLLTVDATWEEAKSIYPTLGQVNQKAKEVSDWNEAKDSGWYQGNAAANAPTPTWWYYGLTIQRSTTYAIQIAWPMTSSSISAASERYFMRYYDNGAWSAWETRIPNQTRRIDSTYITDFRGNMLGNSKNMNSFLSLVRSETDGITGAPQYSSAIGFGCSNTNGYLAIDRGIKQAFVGGGTNNELAWLEKVVLASDIGEYHTMNTAITDWNEAVKSGIYSSNGGQSIKNAPNQSAYVGLVLTYHSDYIRQILFRMSSDNNIDSLNGNERWERIKASGTWGSWKNTSQKQPIGPVSYNCIPKNRNDNLNASIAANFRTQTKGDTANENFISLTRSSIESDAYCKNGATLAFGTFDTNAMLSVAWDASKAILAGGNGNTLRWYKELVFKDDLASAINAKITKSNAVTENNFIPDAKTVFTELTSLTNALKPSTFAVTPKTDISTIWRNLNIVNGIVYLLGECYAASGKTLAAGTIYQICSLPSEALPKMPLVWICPIYDSTSLKKIGVMTCRLTLTGILSCVPDIACDTQSKRWEIFTNYPSNTVG